MNELIRRINIEDCLFFDIETVSAEETLDINSPLYELWKWKNRDRTTGEFKSPKELVELYEKEAALRLGYNKVVSISVAYVRSNKLFLTVFTGDSEEDILKRFFTSCQKVNYLVSYNGISFDMPVSTFNANKYFDISQYLPDKFNTSGKKPWNLGAHIDLMDVLKGTYYVNPSFDECCYAYGVTSPKGDLKGSEVTKEWYKGSKEKVLEYSKGDVYALVNLFRAVRHEDLFDSYEDLSKSAKPTKERRENVFQRISRTKMITLKDEKELQKIYKGKDTSVDNLRTLLEAAMYTLSPDFGTVTNKKEEKEMIDELIKEVLKKITK